MYRRTSHNFEEILKDISNPSVLVMPNNKEHFTLVSDTSGTACGVTLYQAQGVKLRLAGYNLKKLPPVAIRCSISELKFCRLAVNIHSFKHILRNTEFTVIMGHSVLLYILNTKKKTSYFKIKKNLKTLFI